MNRGTWIPRRRHGSGKAAVPGTLLAALAASLPLVGPVERLQGNVAVFDASQPVTQAKVAAAEHSPDANDPVRIELGVGGDDGDRIRQGPRDQEPVERVAVVVRQGGLTIGVYHGDWENR